MHFRTNQFVITLVSLLCLLTSSFFGNAQNEIDILSWNIYMRPREILWDYQVARSKKIVEALNEADIDILVLQELFDGKCRRIMEKGLRKKYPYTAGPGRKGLLKLNSGVVIFSKHPIESMEVLNYSCGGQGADKMAKKGVVAAEIKTPEGTVQVFGTHLQSLGDRARVERLCQFNQMKELAVRWEKEGVAQLFVGDMNTAKRDRELYNEMIDLLKVHDGELDGDYQYTSRDKQNDLVPGKIGKSNIIDYIFIDPNFTKTRINYREVKRFQKSHRKGIKDLSDHLAVYGRINFD
jgi:endonuclease/exonuclease/phosphatase family metal-dependent hydrolase